MFIECELDLFEAYAPAISRGRWWIMVELKPFRSNSSGPYCWMLKKGNEQWAWACSAVQWILIWNVANSFRISVLIDFIYSSNVLNLYHRKEKYLDCDTDDLLAWSLDVNCLSHHNRIKTIFHFVGESSIRVSHISYLFYGKFSRRPRRFFDEGLGEFTRWMSIRSSRHGPFSAGHYA